MIIFHLPAAITISFSQSTYNVNEEAGPARPVLVLSNPSSTNITVQVSNVNRTAFGEFNPFSEL